MTALTRSVDLFDAGRTSAGTSAHGCMLDLQDLTGAFFFKWAVKLARLINPFTMFLKDAAPVCECCRKSVEVSALVILSSLVRYFVCIHCALHQSVWLVFYNHYSTFIPLMMYGCSVVFTCMCMGGSWHYMRSLWMSGVLWIVVPVLQKVVLSSTSYTLPDLLLHAPGLFMHHS